MSPRVQRRSPLPGVARHRRQCDPFSPFRRRRALSGGVDSSVAATLVARAIGGRLTCVFVNNGLLREGEAETVQEVFGRHFGMNLVYVDATESFLRRLAGVTDPEQKRKTMRGTIVRWKAGIPRIGAVE